MSDLNKSLETLRAQAKTFQAIIDLADAMTGVASVEQAVAEGHAKLKTLRDEIVTAEAEATSAKQRATDAEADAAEQANQAKQHAERHVREAEEHADALRKHAETEAAEIVNVARNKAKTYDEKADLSMARVDEATAALATIEAKHAEIQASVDGLLRKLGVA
jgi:multidrug resistance efflux pump